MKVLITGANGYIGASLLPVLLDKGHEVICLVRDKRRFMQNSHADRVQIITGDLLKETSIDAFPGDIDAAYYLAHNIADTPEFRRMQALSAHHFAQALNRTNCKQVIFLSNIGGISSQPDHLASLKPAEEILQEANAAVTVLRTSVIIGPGSLWFGIIRDLVEKLPVITVPGWVKTRCQPIALNDVTSYLDGVLLNEKAFNQTFDIGGPDILSFKDLLLIYAKGRKLNRRIIVLPFRSSKLSSYWLHLLTSIGYHSAQSLVNSLKQDIVMNDHRIDKAVPRQCLTCAEAFALSIGDTEQTAITVRLNNEAALNPKVNTIKKQLH
ncbi:NAD(P)H-binding protein [Mucilaginibacter sp. AW1-3]